MDFSISEEQAMLVDSVAKFIDNDYDFETRQKIAASDAGFSADLWRTYAELGWTAVPFSEEDGGLGGGPVELMLMMEQFGRGLVVEPFLANIVLAGGVMRRLATADQKKKWLDPLIAGELHAALAFAEPQGRFDIANIATTARPDGQDYLLNGKKTLVLNGGAAELLVIPARTDGGQKDHSGITLFAIRGDAPGVTRNSFKMVDGHQGAEVSLTDVRVDGASILGEVGQGYETLHAVIGEATLAVSAEAVGIIRAMQDKTVEYVKNRVQFGVPIGSFQALQHRLVDTLMACEQSYSLLLWAAMTNAAGSDEAEKAISAIKYQIGTAAVHVAREAVQLHGGMGVTWELDIAHFFKRITSIELLFGNADYHLDRYAGLS
ncbi:MAG: acyl-CoA dehydrogenase [Gammaproteobacteria bacterium]|nr:acyl-CoA dehydrogenase [Gammaproteobacteria bacterium]MDH4313851.1 acyl-CoA dehydrogenase [Gammaproteobacteria bacterium]MDH5213671.1 acyl-CoA dehydrogenase [Gammaproteobacteria bacterium]MDH5500443.1 acyl-CoA dehydrogenase [Gammaproteobacteria bacterium]